MHLAARDAIPDSDVSGLVHTDAAHPTEIRVWSVGGLLEHGGRSSRVAQFVPPDPGEGVLPARAHPDGMVYHQGFVGSEVAVGKAIHQAVTERVELLAGAGLRDARAPSTRFRERSHGEVGRSRKSRVSRPFEVHLKIPEVGGIRPQV